MKLFRLIFISYIFINAEFSIADVMMTADDHAPISVMNDHMHKKGQFMLSYRLGNMKMDDVMNGNDSLTLEEIMTAPNSASDGSGTYMNAPVRMSMDMHMFGGMYAPSDYLTLMIMGNYSQKHMTQQRMKMSGSGRFDVDSDGFGDLALSAMISLHENQKYKSHIGVGISLPTGSIDKRDVTPTSSNARLGYSMQNGSGTYDPFILLNNDYTIGNIKLGGQLYYKIRAGSKNSKEYQYGNFFHSTAWSSYQWTKSISTSLKLDYQNLGKMSGSDDEMNPRMSPAMDANNQGYQKINFGFGLNFLNHRSLFKHHRLGIEIILPLYQKYRGIQMADEFKSMLGWQYGF